MTKRALSFQIVAVTLLALGIAFFWALDPILVAIFMMIQSGTTDAELIRQIWHFRLVQPEWIARPNQFIRWQQAEACARLSLVFIAWVASVIALITRHRRGKRRHLTRRSSLHLAGLFPPVIMIKMVQEIATRALARRG